MRAVGLCGVFSAHDVASVVVVVVVVRRRHTSFFAFLVVLCVASLCLRCVLGAMGPRGCCASRRLGRALERKEEDRERAVPIAGHVETREEEPRCCFCRRGRRVLCPVLCPALGQR